MVKAAGGGDGSRSVVQHQAETLGLLLGLHVYGQKLMPLYQAHDELTGACMTAAVTVFDGVAGFERLRDLVTAVPLWTFPDSDEARDAWVVDFVYSMLLDLQFEAA